MATREDAELLVQLMRWGTELGVEDALQTLFSPGFDPEGTEMDPAVGKVLSYGEGIGTFVKHGLLDAELVCDFLWVEGIWAKVRHHVLAVRAEENEPRLYENFEALAARTAPVGAR